MTILKNAIQCKHCGEIIESLYPEDFVVCSCQSVAAYGGRSYLKRVFTTSPEKDYVDVSIVDTENTNGLRMSQEGTKAQRRKIPC